MQRATNTLLKEDVVVQKTEANDLGIGKIVPPVIKILSDKEQSCCALATD